MQTDQIILFNHVVEQGTISQAAKLSHISQPAASKQLQNLEEELGVRLIERTNRGVMVTEAGKIFYEFTKNFAEMYGSITQVLHEWRYNRESLDIMATPVVANYVLPSKVCDLKKEYPHFNFNIVPETTEITIDAIKAGISKLAFAVDVAACKDLVIQKMFRDDIILVSCKDYNVPDKLRFTDFKDHLVIVPDRQHIFYEKVRDCFFKQGAEMESLSYVQKFYSLEAVKNLIINCCGIAFVPRKAVQREMEKGFIKEIKLDNTDLYYEVFALTHKKDEITPVMMELISAVRNS